MASWAPGETAASRIEAALVEGINAIADRVYDDSQTEVPRSLDPEREQERFGETLAESGKSPRTDGELAAGPGKLSAQVRYDAPYATAQHEGHALMDRNGEIVEWTVADYSTPGTKAHYLEDPFKAHLATAEAELGERIKAALEL